MGGSDKSTIGITKADNILRVLSFPLPLTTSSSLSELKSSSTHALFSPSRIDFVIYTWITDGIKAAMKRKLVSTEPAVPFSSPTLQS